ncbi:hypothetical protein FG05_35188 [Fusarium graminearum]|nr:hypothetical protein FG05_35188 [Fusarium graminearum]
MRQAERQESNKMDLKQSAQPDQPRNKKGQ